MSVSRIRQSRRGAALITGGVGFIGTNLAHRLFREGRPVWIYDNLGRPGTEQNLRWLRTTYGSRFQLHRGDLRSGAGLRAALNSAPLSMMSTRYFTSRPKSLSRPASPTHATTSPSTPAGILNLLEEIRAAGRHIDVVFTSTNKVYGALDDVRLVASAMRSQPAPDLRGITEARPLRFHSPYGCSKGTADQYVLDYTRSYTVNATVFRMSCIYGPHQYGTEYQGWVAHFLFVPNRTCRLQFMAMAGKYAICFTSMI